MAVQLIICKFLSNSLGGKSSFLKIDNFMVKAFKNLTKFFKEVSFFTEKRDLWKFFKFCKFLVIPYCMSKILSVPSPPPPPFIIKAPELASVFKAEIDHPFGLLKVKVGNLRGILIVVRVKLEKTTKILPYQYSLHD